MEQSSLIKLANQAFLAGDYPQAASLYLQLTLGSSVGYPGLEANFTMLRRYWLESRESVERQQVGVCSWSLNHNAVGRAITLAEAYTPHAAVEIIGCLIPQFGTELWFPLKGAGIPCHYFTAEPGKTFVRQALDLVVRHPFDVLHLSKPRIHNIIFGWLYQLVWGARIIMDVDDEELAFVKADSRLDPALYVQAHGGLPSLKSLRTREWTRLAVGMVDQFDGVTVSNPALQRRYGGQLISHVRPLARFSPSRERKTLSRAEFGIPQSKTVFLFYGTPRAHKGVAETAQALAQLGREDICYVIAGGEPDEALRAAIAEVEGLDIRWLGPQPYERAPDVVAMGDVCVLLQDVESVVAQFQLPAKLMDALGMGLTVFAQVTPALEDLANKGAFIPVTSESLVQRLREYFDGRYAEQGGKGRAVFESEMTIDAVAPVLRSILADESPRRARQITWEGQLERLLRGQLPKGVPLSQG